MTKTKDPRPKTREVAAVLLAAGRSERMGAFKPLLPFGKETVIQSCIDYLREGGVADIVVVLGYRAGEVEEALGDQHLDFALNSDPESAMSASIACGIRRLSPETKAVLIALTDQPAIPADVVKLLISQWESGNELVIPEFQGRGGHPVLVDLTFRSELLRLDPDRGLKSLFDAHREQVRRIAVSSPYTTRDMDTWGEYRSLHQDVFGTDPPELRVT